MRMPSGVTDQYIYFVAVDATDLKTRETGLTAFTVYRSRNGSTPVAMTTPTITEASAANMPGVYELLLDEDMTIDAGDDSQEMCFHITCTGMAPVTRTIELYRPKVTAGETLGASSGALSSIAANAVNASALATDAVTEIQSGLATAAALTTVAGYIDTEVAAIKAKTDNLPAAPAAVGDIPTAVTIADTLLNRDLATGTDSGSPTVRTVRQALRFLRNKWLVSAGVLTVYKEDDATASWTATVTGDAAANPIVGSDPA